MSKGKPGKDVQEKAAELHKGAKEIELEVRRKKVARLYYLQGYTQEEIAEELGVERKTVQRDLEEVKALQPKHYTKEFAQDLVQKTVYRLEAALLEALKHMSQAKTPSQKAGAAKNAVDILSKQVTLLQDLGIADKAAVKIEINESERFKDAFMHFLASKGLTKEFTEQYKDFLTTTDAPLPAGKAKKK